MRITGLAAHADGFRAELAARGYTPGSAALQLQLAAQLSRWMQARDLEVDGLTAGRVRDFSAQRRARGLKWQVSPQALSWLTGHLAAGGLLPVPEPAPESPEDALLARYRRYLVQERGLAEQTTARYLRVARRFLTACSPGGDVTADSVTAAAALGFLTAECEGKSTG